MAYCSYCAAVLDSSQTVCARCGRPSPTAPATTPLAREPAPAVAPVVAQAVAPAVAGAMPSGVRLAVILLAISCLFSLLSFTRLLVTPSLLLRLSALVLARTIGLSVVWIVLTILVWQRQGWARIAILVLLVWSLGNLMSVLLRLNSVMFSLAFPLLINALHICAVFLLFKADSNAWFKKA